MRIHKPLTILSVFLFLTIHFCVAAYANESPDLSRQGSISITFRYGGQSIPGGTLILYRVGEISGESADYTFTLTEEYALCLASLDDIADPEIAEALATYAMDNQLMGNATTIGAEGKVTFGGLSSGLYLIVQREAAPGFCPAAPFLVSMPYRINNTYIYDVDASPKVDAEKGPELSDPTGPTLPQTGQRNWPVVMLTVTGLSVFAVGWLLRFRRERESHE